MINDNIMKIKMILIGEQFVGKTCIINRYIDHEYIANPGTTIGSNYTSKNITIEDLKKEVILEIWDTAGQELYRSFVKLFYKEAKIAILVYDICNKKSFDEIKNYWYNEVKSYNKNIIIGIAGNKSDLIEKEQVNEDEARKYAKEINAVFRLTSALSNIGIDELFLELIKKYIHENKNQIDTISSEDKSVYDKSYILDKDINNNKNIKKKKNCC